MEYILLNLILPIILAYLIGSIPTSVWVGRVFHKVDVRKEGSGNAGATNTIRVLGLATGLPVLIFDVFKGWFAVYALTFFNPQLTGEQFIYLEICLAAAAVLGHIFPIYAGFNGGKGVATVAGAGMALFPVAFLIILGIFILIFVFTRIVSISSISASIAFPVIVIFILNNPHIPLIILAVAVGIFIPITHRKNIKRLIKGEESKFDFKRKAK